MTQTLAESLAGMALAQLVRPGAPVVLGSFASSMSMQSGAPTFGTPEPAMVLYGMGQLARRLGSSAGRVRSTTTCWKTFSVSSERKRYGLSDGP